MVGRRLPSPPTPPRGEFGGRFACKGAGGFFYARSARGGFKSLRRRRYFRPCPADKIGFKAQFSDKIGFLPRKIRFWQDKNQIIYAIMAANKGGGSRRRLEKRETGKEHEA